MNEGATQTTEVDLKDLICFILKHTKALITVMLIFGVAGVGFLVFKQHKAANTPNSNVLDTTTVLPGETDEEYHNRVANIDRANDIMDNIAALTSQVEIQNNYLSNSVYMQIDPLNTATARIQVVIACDSSISGGVESLYNAYSLAITKGDYITAVADELGYTPGAVQELIGVYFTSTDLMYSNSQEQIGTLNVYVVGPSADETELIMDAVIAEIETISTSLDSTIAAHTITIVGRQSVFGYDATVRKNQLDSVTTLNTIQSQINNLNTNLDNIAKMLGLTDRMDFYKPVVTVSAAESGISFTSCIKYGLVGMVIGLVLVVIMCFMIYLFGTKISSQAQFFTLFRDVYNVGVCKPYVKRNNIQIMLDHLSNDDSDLSEENTNKIISANLNNLTGDVKKILITGTVDSDIVKESIKKLSVTGDVRLDMFSNPSVLQSVSDYDGVVLVEARRLSTKKTVREQITLLKNSGIRIIGAIIL